MTRPGEKVEQITVPLGDPDALLAAAGSLKGVAAQLQDASGQVGASPSLMSSWCGPGSSQFALLTGQEATSLESASTSVLMAGISVQIGADALAEAQRDAQRAIVRAKRAREEINDAKEAIREAVEAQRDAQGRMDAAVVAREAAEFQLFASAVDALVGNGAAEAAIAAADAAYREAERDLREAERREARARDRLKEAQDDLEAARKDGQEAAADAESAGVGLRFALAGLPSGVLAMPGIPVQGQINHAAGIPRPEQRPIPISEQEPPENWPGFAKSLFKIGRGEMTVIAGTVGLAKQAYENPEKIPGALKDVGVHAYNDPIGTGKNLIGYDLLAAGKWEDWGGQAGFAFLSGGMGTMPARASRLNRVVGSPQPAPLGRLEYPINSRKFAGTRFDFRKPGFGMRPGTGDLPRISEADRVALAEAYPSGVRFTRAGYPVFTPYHEARVVLPDLDGTKADFRRANEAAGLTRTPKDFTWHHVEDGRTMELVPRRLHEAIRHTGGNADINAAREAHIAPGGVFSPFEQDLAGFGASVGGGAALAGGASEPTP